MFKRGKVFQPPRKPTSVHTEIRELPPRRLRITKEDFLPVRILYPQNFSSHFQPVGARAQAEELRLPLFGTLTLKHPRTHTLSHSYTLPNVY